MPHHQRPKNPRSHLGTNLVAGGIALILLYLLVIAAIIGVVLGMLSLFNVI